MFAICNLKSVSCARCRTKTKCIYSICVAYVEERVAGVGVSCFSNEKPPISSVDLVHPNMTSGKSCMGLMHALCYSLFDDSLISFLFLKNVFSLGMLIKGASVVKIPLVCHEVRRSQWGSSFWTR